MNQLPKVGILYSYSNVEPEALNALIRDRYQGIIHAGVGNGNIHKNLLPGLTEASRNGILGVRSSRVPTGPTTLEAEIDDSVYGFITSQELNPQKVRRQTAFANGLTGLYKMSSCHCIQKENLYLHRTVADRPRYVDELVQHAKNALRKVLLRENSPANFYRRDCRGEKVSINK